MAEIEFLMPKMGESVMEGTIISWLKQPGDLIADDESVLEVATDKVDTEIPSPQGGVLKKILAQKGETIPVGQAIAILDVESAPSIISSDVSSLPSGDAVVADTVGLSAERSSLARSAPSANAVVADTVGLSAERSSLARSAPSANAVVADTVGLSAERSSLARSAPSANAVVADTVGLSAERSSLARSAPSGDAVVADTVGLSAERSSLARSAPSANAVVADTVGLSAERSSLARSAPSANAVVADTVVLSAERSSLAHSSVRRFYSPLVRSIARREGIDEQTLARIPGTGLKGRLTKRDLLLYLGSGAQPQVDSQVVEPAKPVPSQSVAFSVDASDEIIEMDRIRRMIADRMLVSKQTSAHVTSFVEADVTDIVTWREQVKQSFYEKENEALTLTPIFVQAVVRAIQAFPLVNVSVSGDKIIRHRNIHIGIAVALPTGNLLVPVIHHADRLNLRGLSLCINDLSRRARAGQLKPDELSGGTYTVSNVGGFGNIMGTPIIMQPQCCILAFGAVRKRVVVITDEKGQDSIAIRQMMYLSHSYDHRVIDGALGGMFGKQVSDELKKDEPTLV